MSGLLLAMMLMAATDPEGGAPEPQPRPAGAPDDDYGLVGWCYGALSGYLSLHDRVLPEVTRIEGAYRRPGSSLADDMKVYEDLAKEGRADLIRFSAAMAAAERASARPMRAAGLEAVQKGQSSWAGASNLPDRTVAQQWMGWTLPEVCRSTADALQARSALLGGAFRTEEPKPRPPAEPPPTKETP